MQRTRGRSAGLNPEVRASVVAWMSSPQSVPAGWIAAPAGVMSIQTGSGAFPLMTRASWPVALKANPQLPPEFDVPIKPESGE